MTQSVKSSTKKRHTPKFSKYLSNYAQHQLGELKPLPSFLSTTGKLSLADRKKIVENALTLLDDVYVHLPLKKAMHAIDPVQKLKLLRHRLSETNTKDMDPELEFHKEMLDIFNSLRDLHTNYVLPKPFSDHVALLPFEIESYIKNNKRKFIVTKIFSETLPSSFKPGSEIVYWNGVPMERAVEINADRYAGSNLAARFARGLETMTMRPMSMMLPPDEEWVTIVYKTLSGDQFEFDENWMAYAPDNTGTANHSNIALGKYSDVLGVDFLADQIHNVKKIVFAPKKFFEIEKRMSKIKSVKEKAKHAQGLESIFPNAFYAKKISDKIGYIRIFTFSIEDGPLEFVDEFLRLLMQMPKDGLILDVRGNGGGFVWASEMLLQFLTPDNIVPQPFQFVSSPVTLEISRNYEYAKPWQDSLSRAVSIGAIFSQGIPLTPPENTNYAGQHYHGPVVLITNALCYSATDIFATSFQDHNIGPVIGIDANTGAGGANVWNYEQLRDALKGTRYQFQKLPNGSNMRVSIRRNVRTGENAGTPVEDLGVTPDYLYNMTRKDLLEGNVDLIKESSRILATMPKRQLDVVFYDQPDALEIELTILNISRIDVYIDGQPMLSENVSDGVNTLSIPVLSDSVNLLEIVGLKRNKIVAKRKFNLK
ncbi:MAG: S41 family peptidase [Nitrosopumilus sp.]|nr:S41 family peptidase [Nitrosopumilus sp.]